MLINQKGIAPLFAIIGVVVSTPRPISRQDLSKSTTPKIYTNQKYKFSLTLPQGWGFVEYNPEQVNFGIFDTEEFGSQQNPLIGRGLILSVLEDDGTDLISFANTMTEEIQKGQKLNWQKIKLGGVNGIQSGFECQSNCSVTFLKKDKEIYLFDGHNINSPEANAFLETIIFE